MPTAVLLSGGVDSAVLLAEEALRSHVHPIYIRAGVAWEEAELDVVASFLATYAGDSRVSPLTTLSVDMTDVYPPTHWAREGKPPAYHTPDEHVYLPGRNIVLLGKGGVYCGMSAIDRLVIGSLDHNPFPDATPAFRSAMAAALSLGLGCSIAIDAPYASASKADVVRRGVALGVPFGLTLSCMNPITEEARMDHTATWGGNPTRRIPRHCGRCSKCRERHDGFLEAGVSDPTNYADVTHVGKRQTKL